MRQDGDHHACAILKPEAGPSHALPGGFCQQTALSVSAVAVTLCSERLQPYKTCVDLITAG